MRLLKCITVVLECGGRKTSKTKRRLWPVMKAHCAVFIRDLPCTVRWLPRVITTTFPTEHELENEAR